VVLPFLHSSSSSEILSLVFWLCVAGLLVHCALAQENDTSAVMSPTTAASDVGESAGTTQSQSTTTAAAVSDSGL